MCAAILVVLFGISVTHAQEQPSQKQPPPSTKQQQPLEQKEPTPAKQQTPKTAPQIEEVLPAYEGQNVAAIEVAGRPGLNEQKLASYLVQRQGEPFSVDKIEQSVDALKKSGAAKEIELDIRPEPDGIRVIFVLQPAMYFGIFEFPGAERFAYSRLLQVSDYPPRGAYNATDISRTSESVTKFFQQNGYFEAKVDPEVRTDTRHGLVNVVFHTTLKRKARFGLVVFDGAPAVEEKRLQHDLRSWRARVQGASIRTGKSYSFRRVQKATRFLESQLIKHEYLGSRAVFESTEYDPSNHRADIHFKITTGPPVHVKIEGAHVWARTQRKLLPIYEQAGLDPELLQEGRRNLISYFQAKGFFDAQVESKLEKTPTGEQVQYFIVKGPRRKVAGVEIVGNQALSTKDLSGHLKVEKGRFPLISRGKFSEQLVRASAKNLKSVYQSEGFSSAQVTPEVAEESGNVNVKFRVNEGPRDVVESLRLTGNNTVSESALAPQGLKVVEGQPYSTKKVDEDRNQIIAQYLRMGYLNANFRANARATGKGSHRLNVTYTITEGPRVMVDSVITLGRRVTRQSLIDKIVSLPLEQPIREDDLFRAEGRLYNLGIFDWAQIDPRRQITTQTDEDVLVKVHEARLNELKYGFGFEVINRGGSIPSGTVAVPGLPPVFLPNTFKTSEKTFWGPRGTVQYTRRNFRGLGQTVMFSALGARLLQRASTSFADPYFLGTNWNSTFTLSGERNSENPVFTSRLGDFSFQVQRPLNPDATRQLTLIYSVRQTRLTNLLIPALVPPQDRNVRLSGPIATYSRDTRDNPLDATKGIYQTVQFDLIPTALGSSVSFARLRGQAAYYKDVGKKIIWANSLRIGFVQPFAGSHVPVSELFFSGGGSTLRGFPLNGAGPQQEIPACGNPADLSTCALIRVPTGGRQLLIINSEFRIPVPLKKGLGLAAFYDGGNVFQHVGFRDLRANYSNTIGIGLRYATPVGPVRVDVGHNLNPLAGIKATQIFITLGQAF